MNGLAILYFGSTCFKCKEFGSEEDMILNIYKQKKAFKTDHLFNDLLNKK